MIANSLVAALGFMERSMEIRHYSAQQVLSWWREHASGPEGNTAIGPCGYPSSTIKLDPVSSGVRINRKYLAWVHVERFFIAHFEWHHAKAILIMDEPTECLAVFERWYDEHPMMVTADVGIAGTVPCPELVPMRLSEALEAYNRTAKAGKRRKIKSALDAIARGALNAWRPRGKRWYTTEDEIRRWIESDERKTKCEAA